MSTITLYSSNENHTLTVPPGTGLYWANRCCALLPGQLALVVVPNEVDDLPYLGFVRYPDDELIMERLAAQYAR